MSNEKEIFDALVRIGLLPPAIGDASVLASCEDANLLPAIVKLWRESVARQRKTLEIRSEKIFQWLEAGNERGAALTIGVPSVAKPVVDEWLGTRLVWWPKGIPHGRRIGLVSSRLTRDLDSWDHWFTLLRAACSKLNATGDVLVTSESTAAAPFVERAAELFGLSILKIEMPRSNRTDVEKWFRDVIREESSADVPQFRVVVSPPLVNSDVDKETPIRDRALLALSDCVYVFHVRSGGNLQRLLERQLRERDAWPPGSVFVAVDNQKDGSAAKSLLDAGAVGWLVSTEENADAESRPSENAKAKTFQDGPTTRSRPAPIIEIPDAADWPYLTHWTRRRTGPWPDQSEADFLDDLILNRRDRDHSALAALARIIHERRLRASREAVRGVAAVTSFTAVPLGELVNLRVYRAHRGRWDFERYGICLRREWLKGLGAWPVCYGGKDDFGQLDETEKTFFQLRKSKTRRGDIDWTVEREWRVLGDVELRKLPADTAFVFVPSREEAAVIAAISPWPVAVIQAGD